MAVSGVFTDKERAEWEHANAVGEIARAHELLDSLDVPYAPDKHSIYTITTRIRMLAAGWTVSSLADPREIDDND